MSEGAETPLEFKYLPRDSVRDATYARLRGAGWMFLVNKTNAAGVVVSMFFRPAPVPTTDDYIAADKAASPFFNSDEYR